MIHPLFVLAAAVLWGTTGTAQALGPDGLDPMLVGAGRLVLGGGLLLGYSWVAGAWRGGPGRWRRRDLVLAAACVAAYQLCFFAGVARAGVAVGTLITIGSAPVFTGILGALAGQGRPGRAWAGATALAIAGCIALVLGGQAGTGGSAPVLGVLLALGAGASYAGYTVSGKVLVAGMPSSSAAMAAVFGGAGLLLLPVLVERVAVVGGRADPAGTVAVVVYLAVVPTAVAYVLFGRGLVGLPPPVVATLSLAEPLVATILGVAVLGEAVSRAQMAGAALVFAGLAGSMWAARTRTDMVAGSAG